MPHTFSLWCTIAAEQTFTEDQLEDDPEGSLGDVTPREDVLRALEAEIRAAVGPLFQALAVEVEADQG